MSTGKIKTLFSDKEKTEALFPRTKTSAVSNSEGKGLDAILENLPYFSDADSSKVANVPLNADTLGGHPVSDFALAYDVENMTAADVGAAPAGYGLGETCKNIDSIFNITRNGWWVTNGDTPNGLWLLCHSITTNGGKDTTITGWDMNGTNWYKITKKSDVWGSWQTMREAISAAPAGYGLGPGTGVIDLTSNDDLNRIRTNGWYGWYGDVPQNAPNSYCIMRVWTGCGAFYAVQETYSGNLYNTNVIMRRTWGGSSWSAWEWVNPPMMISVEYRTTERYNDKPVYCKLIDGGYLPNTGTKSYKVAENALVFSVDGTNIRTVSLGSNIASTLQSDQVVSCYVGGDTVHISCGGDRSNIPFKFTAKYTKTTD